MLPLLMQVRTTLAQHEPKSALILGNYEGAEIDDKVAMKIKEVLALDRPSHSRIKAKTWQVNEPS